MAQEFTATIQKKGSRVFIPIPFDPDTVWGQKPRHHIRGTINGMMIRGPLDIQEEVYFLSLGPAWRRNSGVDAGTEVHVVLDAEGPQQEMLAEDIAQALGDEPTAADFFNGLATFYRKGYIRWIEGAKRPETRAKRIAETVDLLKAGQKQR